MPSDAEQQAGPVAAGRVIGSHLRRLRESAGMNLRDVAPAVHVSTAKLSRLERGLHPPKPEDVLALLEFFGVTEDAELDAVQQLLAQSTKKEWWHQFSDVVTGWMGRLIATESAATEIRTYQCYYVPGLLQTPEYARAVVSSPYEDPSKAPRQQISRRVDARMMRQQILTGDDAPHYHALLDEGVLQRWVGSPAIFREQLRHLFNLAENRDRVTILIVPFRAATAGISPNPCITYMKFTQGGPQELVYLEQMPGGRYVSAPAEIEEYRRIMLGLANAALGRRESMGRLESAIEALAGH